MRWYSVLWLCSSRSACTGGSSVIQVQYIRADGVTFQERHTLSHRQFSPSLYVLASFGGSADKDETKILTC